MVLIDIGNSYSKILKEDEFLTVRTDQIIKWLNRNFKNEIFICSVVPKVTTEIKKLFPHIKILDNKIYDKLFDIHDSDLYKKGSDRIVTGYGALKKYNKNLIVIDMGTCITVDVYVNSEYTSGYIFPGLNILRGALVGKVDHLPTPIDPIKISENIIDTSDQMFWGNIYGIIGAINQFVSIESEKNNIEFPIVITGGTIKEFESFLKSNQLQNLFKFKYEVDSKLIFDSMKFIIKEGIIS